MCAPSFRQLCSVTAVAAPVFGDPRAGHEPVYFSDLVVRESIEASTFADLAGCKVGYNDLASLSGYGALQERLAQSPVDVELVHTGGHRSSLELLATGRIDAAPIDSNTLFGLGGLPARLRVLETWGPYPVQPVVVRRSIPPDQRAAVADSARVDGRAVDVDSGASTAGVRCGAVRPRPRRLLRRGELRRGPTSTADRRDRPQPATGPGQGMDRGSDRSPPRLHGCTGRAAPTRSCCRPPTSTTSTMPPTCSRRSTAWCSPAALTSTRTVRPGAASVGVRHRPRARHVRVRRWWTRRSTSGVPVLADLPRASTAERRARRHARPAHHRPAGLCSCTATRSRGPGGGVRPRSDRRVRIPCSPTRSARRVAPCGHTTIRPSTNSARRRRRPRGPTTACSRVRASGGLGRVGAVAPGGDRGRGPRAAASLRRLRPRLLILRTMPADGG